MTAKVTATQPASNYGRAIVIVIGMYALIAVWYAFSLFIPRPFACSFSLSLSLSRFITSTIGTIDPMITAENIIVNTYDPLMTMDHSRYQIASGWNRVRARARVSRRNRV